MSTEPLIPYSTTIHVRDTCLCLHAQRAARVLARRFDVAFAPVGLTSGQFSLLNGLNRPEPPTLGAVARLLAMDRSTVTANLKPLERKGLVETTTDARDRRSRRASLTDAGRAILAEALPIWQREHARLDADLTDVSTLRSSLNEVAATA